MLTYRPCVQEIEVSFLAASVPFSFTETRGDAHMNLHLEVFIEVLDLSNFADRYLFLVATNLLVSILRCLLDVITVV
jgi:hypothetical protein